MKRNILLLMALFITSYAFTYTGDLSNLPKAVIQLGDKQITVEVADYPAARERGLMYRRSMAENAGMLFVFERAEYLSFWMRNTYIPLDIGYFDGKKNLIEVYQMEPLDETTTDSTEEAQYALEMNKGWFEKNNIPHGAKLKIIRLIKND